MGPSSPVKIVEIMGRNAGWLTAASGLGRVDEEDPPHLIYVPERPVVADALLQDVARVVGQHEHCVIALSEGAVTDTGTTETDAFGHKMKGGAAEYLAALISDQLDLKVRIDKPNYLQRSFTSTMSEVDADEAYRVGRAAVRLAVTGQSGLMVTLERRSGEDYYCETGTAPLDAVANAERMVPDAYLSDRGNDVTPAFVAYARPLIGAPLPPLSRLVAAPIAPAR
jgi:6-phosphofructokinase 1